MISDFKSVPGWLDWFEFELELESRVHARVSDFRFQDCSDWFAMWGSNPKSHMEISPEWQRKEGTNVSDGRHVGVSMG